MSKHGITKFTPLILLLFILLYTFIQNYGFLIADSYDHVLFIERYKDSSFLENDWATNQIPTWNVRFFFTFVMATLSNFIPLALVFFLAFVINGVLLLLGVYALIHTLLKSKNIAYLTCFLITFSVQKIAGDFAILAPYLTQPQLSMTLSIWAFYFFFQKRYNIMYLLLGISTLNHIMIGLNSAMILSIGLLFVEKMKTLKHYLHGTIFYFPFALLNLIPTILTSLKESTLVDATEVMYVYTHVRVPWHMEPFQFSITAWLSFLVILGMFFYSYSQLKKNQPLKKMLLFVWIILAFFVVAILAHIAGIAFIEKLQFFRQMIFLRLFLYGVLSAYLIQRFKEYDPFSKFVTLALIASFIDYLLIITLPLFVIYDRYLCKRLNQQHLYFFLAFVLGGVLIGFGILYQGVSFYSYEKIILRLLRTISWIVIVSCGYWFVHAWNKREWSTRALKGTSIVAIILALCLVGILNFQQDKGDSELEDAYAWIKERTPHDSIFLINPALEDFRLKAERAVVVDFKILPFKETLMLAWYERIQDVTNNVHFAFRGNRKKELTQGFSTLTTLDVTRIGEKYGAELVLVEKPQSLNLDILYENSAYQVYVIR